MSPCSPPTPALDTAWHPFVSAADAWFWYMACHQAKVDGARVVAGRSLIARPCEPADIHLAVLKLLRKGRLAAPHLRVLVRYGRMMTGPDPGRSSQMSDCILWEEAMAELTTALGARGIVA